MAKARAQVSVTGRTFWVHSSWAPSVFSIAAGLGVALLWITENPAPAVLLAVPTIVLALSVSRHATLYPNVYQGRWLGFLALALALTGFNLSLGDVAYGALWRESFGVFGQTTRYEHPAEGWSVRYPRTWRTLDMTPTGATTILFRPQSHFSSMQFSLTRRELKPGENLERVLLDHMISVRRDGGVLGLGVDRVPYPEGLSAGEVSYETDAGPIPMRRRDVFVIDGGELYVLSLAAPPPWHAHFKNAFDSFLLSLRPPPRFRTA